MIKLKELILHILDEFTSTDKNYHLNSVIAKGFYLKLVENLLAICMKLERTNNSNWDEAKVITFCS